MVLFLGVSMVTRKPNLDSDIERIMDI